MSAGWGAGSKTLQSAHLPPPPQHTHTPPTDENAAIKSAVLHRVSAPDDLASAGLEALAKL